MKFISCQNVSEMLFQCEIEPCSFKFSVGYNDCLILEARITILKECGAVPETVSISACKSDRLRTSFDCVRREDMAKLASKTAIITGAGSGIGKAIAMTFSENGANVVVADVNLEAAEKTAYQINDNGRRGLAVGTDVTKKDQVLEMAEQCLRQFGTIEILVNNAGVMSPPTPMEDLPEEYWDRVVEINLKGTFLCSQVVGKEMIKAKKGCIVNMASMCGHGPYPECGAYSATKGAILSFTQQLAIEWAEYNIRVNSISPGTILTPLNENVYADREIYEGRSKLIPLHRPGYPQDIANAALFLASEDSSYITGTDILVDGGLLKIAQQMLPGRAGAKER